MTKKTETTYLKEVISLYHPYCEHFKKSSVLKLTDNLKKLRGGSLFRTPHRHRRSLTSVTKREWIFPNQSAFSTQPKKKSFLQNSLQLFRKKDLPYIKKLTSFFHRKTECSEFFADIVISSVTISQQPFTGEVKMPFFIYKIRRYTDIYDMSKKQIM